MIVSPSNARPPAPSYRALLSVPSVGRVLLSMQIARIGQSMMSVAIVLFALNAYRSSALAGMATFFGLFPGLLGSPIAGALLDRHGRARLVVLDYLVAMGSMMLMGGLALAGLLPPWLLMTIAAIASMTAPLSSAGLRSLFPILIPTQLWERANAIDSTGFVLATIIGPPIAAMLVAFWGGPGALIAIGGSFGAAAIAAMGAPDPRAASGAPGPLLRDAWDGLAYTWRNPTLRGLGVSISVANLLNGVLTIVIPLIVLRRLHLDMRVVGLVIAVQGVTGLASAIYCGRHDSRNRERMMLAVPMVVGGAAALLLLLHANLWMLVLVMAIFGLLSGPLDIALFTLRQRRTDRAWTGRAFAVSMSFNSLGVPIGSAIGGLVATHSINGAIVGGSVASVLGGALVMTLIPPPSTVAEMPS